MKKYFTPLAKLLLVIFLITVTACASIAQEIDKRRFHSWLIKFNPEAEQAGISSQTLYYFMKDAQFEPKVIKLDRKQPDKVKTFDQYIEAALPPSRIKTAREKYRENEKLLTEIGNKYGVQPRFIVALWGIESNFGTNMGSYNVLNALATLAYEGRRAAFFKKELINALKILDDGHIQAAEMKGSWAGAMGQTQFMPSSYLKLAVDYDGDGRKDIWTTKADAFASIANYLSQVGWDSNSTWGREVKLPKNFDAKLIGKETERTLAEWNSLGVKNLGGSSIPTKAGITASIVKMEDKANSRTFLIYKNYKTVLHWNRSLYFATAVGMLADKVGE